MTHDRPYLVTAAQDARRHLVPRDHRAPCEDVRRLIITSVLEVANVDAWKMYTFGQQEVAQALRQRSDCPWATDVAPAVADLARFFPYVRMAP